MNTWSDPQLIYHSQLLAKSYKHWLKRDLMPLAASLDAVTFCQRLFEAPFALVSHGTEIDPILNYGNEAALKLWDLSWEEFIQTPSRQTAGPENQATRAALMAKVMQDGFIENYEGVRISSKGRRFKIIDAIVWNLLEESQEYAGQAALIKRWQYID